MVRGGADSKADVRRLGVSDSQTGNLAPNDASNVSWKEWLNGSSDELGGMYFVCGVATDRGRVHPHIVDMVYTCARSGCIKKLDSGWKRNRKRNSISENYERCMVQRKDIPLTDGHPRPFVWNVLDQLSLAIDRREDPESLTEVRPCRERKSVGETSEV